MGKQQWKVWLTGRDTSREGIVRALEAAGCTVTLGRIVTSCLLILTPIVRARTTSTP